jgi:hypothetical protein
MCNQWPIHVLLVDRPAGYKIQSNGVSPIAQAFIRNANLELEMAGNGKRRRGTSSPRKPGYCLAIRIWTRLDPWKRRTAPSYSPVRARAPDLLLVGRPGHALTDVAKTPGQQGRPCTRWAVTLPDSYAPRSEGHGLLDAGAVRPGSCAGVEHLPPARLSPDTQSFAPTREARLWEATAQLLSFNS